MNIAQLTENRIKEINTGLRQLLEGKKGPGWVDDETGVYVMARPASGVKGAIYFDGYPDGDDCRITKPIDPVALYAYGIEVLWAYGRQVFNGTEAIMVIKRNSEGKTKAIIYDLYACRALSR